MEKLTDTLKRVSYEDQLDAIDYYIENIEHIVTKNHEKKSALEKAVTLMQLREMLGDQRRANLKEQFSLSYLKKNLISKPAFALLKGVSEGIDYQAEVVQNYENLFQSENRMLNEVKSGSSDVTDLNTMLPLDIQVRLLEAHGIVRLKYAQKMFLDVDTTTILNKNTTLLEGKRHLDTCRAITEKVQTYSKKRF